MPESPNADSPRNRSRQRAELSSHQLIVAICVFLVAALVCFMLGVLVGTFSRDEKTPAVSEQTAEESPASDAAPDEQEPAAPEEDLSQGVPAYPRAPKVVLPALKPDKEETVEPLPAPAPDESVEEPDEEADALPEEQPVEPVPAQVQAEAPPDPSPSTQTAGRSQDEMIPLPVVEPAPTPPSPSGLAKGMFCVQVASLSAPNRQQAGEELARKLKRENGLDAALITSANGKNVFVVVGATAERAEADALCKELRKNPKFDGCWVREID